MLYSTPKKLNWPCAITFVLTLVFLSACVSPQNNMGHETGSLKDTAEKIIVIPLFYNATSEPILEKKLTRIFKETFYTQGWQVQNKQGNDDKTLSGKITVFSLSASALGLTGGARAYQMRILMDIEILQGASQEHVFKTSLEGIADYVARPNAAADRAAKNRAIREAGREMAERVAAFLEMPLSKKNDL